MLNSKCQTTYSITFNAVCIEWSISTVIFLGHLFPPIDTIEPHHIESRLTMVSNAFNMCFTVVTIRTNFPGHTAPFKWWSCVHEPQPPRTTAMNNEISIEIYLTENKFIFRIYMTGRWVWATVDGCRGGKERRKGFEIIKYLYCNNKERERRDRTTNPIPVNGTLFLLRAPRTASDEEGRQRKMVGVGSGRRKRWLGLGRRLYLISNGQHLQWAPLRSVFLLFTPNECHSTAIGNTTRAWKLVIMPGHLCCQKHTKKDWARQWY